MAGSTTDNYVAKQLPAAFLNKFNGLFAVNDNFEIDELDFLALVQDMANNMVFQSALTALNVRGSVLPLQNKDELATVDPAVMVVGQFANVADDVTAPEATANAAAGNPAKAAQYRLIRDSTGVQYAFVNAKVGTTVRVKVSWVKVSGTDEEKVLSYKFLQLEDAPLSTGDVRKWTFLNGQTRLVEVKRAQPQPGNGAFNANPDEAVGLDDGTNPDYRLFSPLKGGLTREEVLALLSVTMTAAEAQEAAQLGKLPPAGLRLRITNRSFEEPDIYVHIISGYEVGGDVAYSVYEDEEGVERQQPVYYDLANDYHMPRNPGATQQQINFLDSRIGTLEARANSVAGLFRRNGQFSYLSATQLNNLVSQPGDVVSLLNGINTSTWLLKSGVTYHTNGIPLKVDLITDGGVSIQAQVLGGSPYSTTKRFGSFTGATTDVTLDGIDCLSQGEGGTTMIVANGATVRLTGLFNGQGGCGARVSHNSKFYYQGYSRPGGGHLIWADGTAYVEFKMMNSDGYYLAPVRAEGNAVVDFYCEGLVNANNTGYALSQAVRTSGSAVVNLRKGLYTNSGGQPTLVMDGTSRINLSSIVSVYNTGVAVYGPASATLGQHDGAEIVGTFAAGVTIEQLPSDLPAGGNGGPGDPNADDLIAPLFNAATGDFTLRTADGETHTVNIRGKARLVATFPAGVPNYVNELRILFPSQVGSYLLESIAGMIFGHIYKVNGVEVPGPENLQMNDVLQIIGQAQSGASGTIVLIQA